MRNIHELFGAARPPRVITSLRAPKKLESRIPLL
jgi:hypothetical protein